MSQVKPVLSRTDPPDWRLHWDLMCLNILKANKSSTAKDVKICVLGDRLKE